MFKIWLKLASAVFKFFFSMNSSSAYKMLIMRDKRYRRHMRAEVCTMVNKYRYFRVTSELEAWGEGQRGPRSSDLPRDEMTRWVEVKTGFREEATVEG